MSEEEKREAGDADGDRMDWETYKEERKLLIEGESAQSRAYDKYLLLLSGGALAFSLTLVEQIAPQARSSTYPLVVVSWFAFGAAICGMLTSMLVSQKAFQRQRDILDLVYREGEWPSRERSFLGLFVWWLNLSSLIAFLAGSFLLALFASVNLPW